MEQTVKKFNIKELKLKDIKEFISSIPYNKITIKDLLSFEKTTTNKIAAGIIALLLGFFAIGVLMYLLHGHHAYNVTREHPWGLLISSYIFFVGVSTGLCIIASFGHIFGIKEFDVIGKRTTLLAIVTLLTGFSVILLEIGHPIRMIIYNMLSPGLTSAIWWMGTLYSLVLGFIIIEFIFILKNDHKWSYIFGVGGLIADVAAFSTLGSIFGYLVARPVSNGPFYPIYFILTAVIAGAFFLFLIYGFKYKLDFPKEIEAFLVKMAKILGLLLAILIFFEFWRVMTAIYGGMPERSDTMIYIIKGISFQLEVALGMILPFLVILLSKGKAIKTLVFTSFIGIVSIFFMRADMVHNTQLKPLQMMKTEQYQLAPEWIHYFPSITEIMISLGGLGICLALYYVGTKLFNLDDSSHH
ncbi:Polysulphide reductase, NrfD [sediment metagenome]|uniref:Polysulphide reductase, NrfD n=1 Tax=sediment metagenome TaxID=749907 RepID=D9PHL5_9ZZZZ